MFCTTSFLLMLQIRSDYFQTVSNKTRQTTCRISTCRQSARSLNIGSCCFSPQTNFSLPLISTFPSFVCVCVFLFVLLLCKVKCLCVRVVVHIHVISLQFSSILPRQTKQNNITHTHARVHTRTQAHTQTHTPASLSFYSRDKKNQFN